MPTTTTQGAVSDYEYLNSRAYRSAGSHNVSLNDNESDEQEYLPLKLPGKASILPLDQSCDSMILENVLPHPSPWSPCLSSVPKPSVTLTPLKSGFLNSNNSNISYQLNSFLDTKDRNNPAIPVPTAWTDDMNFRPEPSLFVTPEKINAKNQKSFKNLDKKENIIPEDLRSKSKLSVRFELPNAGLGNKTCDSEILDVSSPIEVKGKELCDASLEKLELSSKAKAYDPMSYSDESVLEEQSFVEKFKTLLNANTLESSSSIEKSSTDLIGTPLEVASTSEDEKEHSPSHSPSRNCKRKLIRKAKSPNNQLTRKSLTVRTPSSSPPRNLKSKQTVDSTKAGPQFLKSPLCQYDHQPPIPCIIRESKNRHEETDYSFPFDASSSVKESNNAFARPEFNSTLKLKSELDNLSRLEVDVDAALMNTLAKSEEKRTEVNEKASALTNRQSEQFHDLVPLEASVEGLIRRQVKLKSSKVKAKPRSRPASKISDDEGPDLMEFFSPDIQHESPDLSLPGVPPVTFSLQSMAPDQTFSLYRHSRMWNGINDY